jgi:hypothetical protein
MDSTRSSEWANSEGLEDGSSVICRRVGEELDAYTVALLQMYPGASSELAGSGTLVSVLGAHYILTARHVWDEKFAITHKRPAKLGIAIKKSPHKYGIDLKEFGLFGPNPPQRWDKWGPDIALLRMPAKRAQEIYAYGSKNFFNLSKPRRSLGESAFQARMLMGAPHTWGRFADGNVDLDVGAIYQPGRIGAFSPVHFGRTANSDFDYVDFDVDTSLSTVPQDFKGVSGGGLWSVCFERSELTGEIEHSVSLEGVPFDQTPLQGCLTVRCHGPQSLGLLVRLVA